MQNRCLSLPADFYETALPNSLCGQSPADVALKLLAARAIENSNNKILLSDSAFAFTGRQVGEFTSEIIQDLSPVKGGIVGVVSEPGAMQAILFLGVLLSGSTPLLFDGRLDNRKIQKLIKKFNVSWTMFGSTVAMVETELDRIVCRNRSYILTRNSSQANAGIPEDSGCVLLTSGSSGEPKGVLVRSSSLIYTCIEIQNLLKLSAKTKSVMTLPLHHTMGLNTQFLPTLLAGGQVHFANSEWDLPKSYRAIVENNASFVSLVSDLLPVYQKEYSRRKCELASSVENVQIAGGMIPASHLGIARDLFPNALLHKGYGLTEGIRVCMLSSKQKQFWSNSSGKPLRGQVVEIRRSDGSECSSGEVGEICVSGPNVMHGYIGDHGLIPIEGGVLKTGDQGFLNANGELSVLGRADEIIKINGRKVALREIEAVARKLLCKNLVKSCAVFYLPLKSKPISRIVLGVECESFAKIDREYWQQFENSMFKALEGYKVPKAMVSLLSFPTISNHKINRKKLRQSINETVTEPCKLRTQRGMRLYFE